MAVLSFVSDYVVACGQDVVTWFEVAETVESRATPLPEVRSTGLVIEHGMILYPFGTLTVNDLLWAKEVRNRLIVQATPDTLSYATSQVLSVHIGGGPQGRVWVKTQNVLYIAHTAPPKPKSWCERLQQVFHR